MFSRLLTDALHVGLPVNCAGCGRWDTPLCGDCAALLAAPPHRVEHVDAAGQVDVWALSTYTGPVRPLVLGWKNGAREDLGPVMAVAGERAGHWLAGQLRPEAVSAAQASGCLLVVPAPSGLGRRLRGRLVAADLADAVARGLAAGWSDAAPPRSARSG
ncbi:hypothetical protein BW737_009760 [Actinomyces ruminis]|uniref:Amidophosphoribosyltransferase n=1 Tax=Actinomyces ruminis TaxID=1937003 RepID=A0ABX4MA91_9ACTO|nr:hypothetical protein BW737_009760 [Actinomyces ruminis]